MFIDTETPRDFERPLLSNQENDYLDSDSQIGLIRVQNESGYFGSKPGTPHLKSPNSSQGSPPCFKGGAAASQPYIGGIEEAPEYHKFNTHIKNGYRINYHTWSATAWSLFQCHNETVNVWSHFIGFWITLVFLCIVLCNYESEKAALLANY